MKFQMIHAFLVNNFFYLKMEKIEEDWRKINIVYIEAYFYGFWSFLYGLHSKRNMNRSVFWNAINKYEGERLANKGIDIKFASMQQRDLFW